MALYYPHGNVFYRNLHRSYPLIQYGKGSCLYDSEGNQYLDASGGAAVVNIGHGVEEIASSLTAQSEKIGYLNGTQFSHPPVESLAKSINDFLPFPEGKVYFLTSGSEAIEASIKLARQYWEEQGRKDKYCVISLNPSYHGNTLAALALSGRAHYKDIYRPMLIKSSMIPAPYCYRCFYQETYPSCKVKCAQELEKRILDLEEKNVSAFITEVIGGSSTGAAVPPLEYFSIIREICDKYEVLLIVDEILTGIGRTGEWLACNHFDLKPDIIALGKGLTSGYFPLSAVTVGREIVDTIYEKGKNFLHAQTFSHHPVGCAAGLATLDYIRKHNLLLKCAQQGSSLMEELEALLILPNVGDIRGKGLLIGIELVSKKKGKIPFPRAQKYVEKFISKALKKGLVLWPNVGHADGVNGDLILLAPPFTISFEEICLITEILKEILEETNTL